MREIAPGARHYPNFLGADAQEALAREIARVIAQAPLFTSHMPKSGLPMSVRMTNCGDLGWMSDREKGYRYEPEHPQTGARWPPIPQALLAAWEKLTRYPRPPQCCLVNVYASDARMGLHQDRDETDFEAPILSLSLGADCRFRLGGRKRSDKCATLVLSAGDALTLSGPARLAFHGVDRLLAPTPGALFDAAESAVKSSLLPTPLDALGARINLTLRRVT
jgi:alkylated DNA repair protein (DNA oxidative demethylase)